LAIGLLSTPGNTVGAGADDVKAGAILGALAGSSPILRR
jgi:hypothetical protein